MGEVIEVAGGYARNYLIPRGMAVAVTRGGVKQIRERQKVLEVKSARMREQLQSVADRIHAQKIVITARCSQTGKLFGSITNRQLAHEIEAAAGEEIDRHKLVMDERIRTVGTYHALLKLHPDVEIDIEFEVAGEGFVAEEPPEAEGEAVPGEETVVAEGAEAAAEPIEEQPSSPEEGEAEAEEESESQASANRE